MISCHGTSGASTDVPDIPVTINPCFTINTQFLPLLYIATKKAHRCAFHYTLYKSHINSSERQISVCYETYCDIFRFGPKYQLSAPDAHKNLHANMKMLSPDINNNTENYSGLDTTMRGFVTDILKRHTSKQRQFLRF